MIALVGALKEETKPLRRRMGLGEVPGSESCRLYRGAFRGRDVVLAQGGMGRQNAEAAARLVLERYPVTLLISYGFAGALHDALATGDVVLYSTVTCTDDDGRDMAGHAPHAPDRGVLAWAEQALERASVKVLSAPGITSTRLVADPQDKRKLGQAFDAKVVDMESYWIAEVCAGKRVPFLAVRSVTDTVSDAMPALACLMTLDGRLTWRDILVFMLRRPEHLASMWRLYRNARRARASLVVSMNALMKAPMRQGG